MRRSVQRILLPTRGAARLAVCIAALLALALLLPIVASAQAATPLPFDPLTPVPRATPVIIVQQAAEAPDFVATAQAAAEMAQNAAVQVAERQQLAFNLFGLFEVITGFFALVIPVGAIALGVFGWSQIRQSRDQGVQNRMELQRSLDMALQNLDGRLDTYRQEIERRLSDVATDQHRIELELREEQRLFTERLRQAQREDLAEARRQFNEAVEQRSNELVAMNQQISESAADQKRQLENAALAGALIPMGERQYRAGDLQGARDTYLRALSLDSSNPIIYYKLGYVCVHSDDFDTAEQYLEKSLALEPNFPAAMATLGYTYRRQAEKAAREAKAPDISDEERSQRLMQSNHLYSKAESTLISALKHSPRLVDEDNESWYGSLGGLYNRRGQIESAIDAYNHAALVTPYSSYPFVNLAILHMNASHRDEMLARFRAAERLARAETTAKADNYYGFADLFTAQLALGKLREADETFALVCELAPLPSALESLRSTLEKLTLALGGEQAAPHISTYIERLNEQITQTRDQHR